MHHAGPSTGMLDAYSFVLEDTLMPKHFKSLIFVTNIILLSAFVG